jgi:hypothetical protein
MGVPAREPTRRLGPPSPRAGDDPAGTSAGNPRAFPAAWGPTSTCLVIFETSSRSPQVEEAASSGHAPESLRDIVADTGIDDLA